MPLYNAMKEEFEEITILGKPAILACVRIDKTTVPSGYYKYELCNDQIFDDDPIEIAKSVNFNHWGTVIMRDRITLPIEGSLYVKQDALRLNTGDCQSMNEFIEKYPPRVKPPQDLTR